MEAVQICPNKAYGKHITVRCAGCNSVHSTKNIGECNPESKAVFLERSLFDILGAFCLCEDQSEYPLIHDCEIDDSIEYKYVGSGNAGLGARFNPVNSKHIAYSQKAREVLQGWWKRFTKSKNLDEPTQEELDGLVLLREGARSGS